MKIISALLPAIMSLLEAVLPILDVVIELLGPILDLIAGLLAPILDLITMALAPLIKVVVMLISMAFEPLGPLIEWVGGLLTGQLGNAISAIQPIIQGLTTHFAELINFITSVFTGDWQGAWEAVKNIFSNIVETFGAIFKAPLNSIINSINTFIGGLNQIKIPDWVPGVGGKGINVPLIPTLATGGFTDGISIAGEAGMEAVISFDPAFRNQNLGYWAEAGEMLGAFDDSGDDGLYYDSGSGTVVYELGDITFAPVIQTEADIDEDALIRKLRDLGPEFVDLIMEVIAKREGGAYVSANGRVF